jgi:rifampicin phosphotransferase
MTLLRSGGDGRCEPGEYGGKACGLWELVRDGHDVPPFLALPASAFVAHLRGADGDGTLSAALAGLEQGREEEVGERLRTAVEGWPMDPELGRELLAAHAAHLDGAAVAVRSSAVGEDGSEHSFAGQHDSFLHVDGETLIDGVRRCWASAFTARALVYRRIHGIDLRQQRMGVVIQPMVDGQVSGVMFTVHPVSGDRDRLLISAVFGLGEGLVSGELDADSYEVHRISGRIDCQVADKGVQIVGIPGGTRRAPVADDRRNERCLTDGQARQLADIGVALHARRGAPQDVEWTLADDRLWLLQSRPITALPPPPAVPEDAGTIWDNSNIIESYTGVTSPLTFSFAKRAYEIVYRQFHDIVGVPAEVIEGNGDLYPNILGLLHGRVYYNLINVYRLIALLPGFEFNKPLLEQMMGLKDVAEFAPERPVSSPARRYLVELPRLLRTAATFGHQIATVDGRVDGFFELFEEVVDDYDDADFRAMDPADIARCYEDLERRLLWQWKVPIVNDFAVMIFYGVLRSLTDKWGIDDTGSLHHELLCGEGGLMSTEPAKAALRIALRIGEDPAVAKLFRSANPEALAAALANRQPESEVWDWIDDYLDRFGYRCVGELKLEERTLKDDPAVLMASLQGYLGGAPPDPDELDRRERDKRRAAEHRVDTALARRPLRRTVYRWFLKKARNSVRDRENMRFCRTRIFGLSRDLFRGLGWQLHRMGELADPDDVFYLTVPDLFDLVHGTSTCTDLRGLAAVRRAEFDGYRAEEDPADHLVTRGIPYRNNPMFAPPRIGEPPGADGALAGTPCSPGRVRAPVRVVRTPRGEPPLNGEILVAARTDPGWVTLFPSAAGLLIERGSPLSHSAVVARELGIPAIVGIGGLLEAVEAGQEVEMDGGAGTVRLDP